MPGDNWGNATKIQFSASLSREGKCVVAQCLDVDVASQGPSEDEALANLGEALELHFGEPRAGTTPIEGVSR